MKNIWHSFAKPSPMRCTAGVLALMIAWQVFFATPQARAQVTLPILMYHHFMLDATKHNDYVISPNQFEEDIVALQQEGYTFVSVQQMVNYVFSGAELPPKPILLTIDDGQQSGYYYAFPILKKYNVPALLSVIGSQVETYTALHDTMTEAQRISYGYLTYTQIEEMIESGFVEIGNHTYDMHTIDDRRKGVLKTQNETLEEYERIFGADIEKTQALLEANLGYQPRAFTYPFGFTNAASDDVVRGAGFVLTFGCAAGVNTLSADITCLYNMKRFNRNYLFSAQDILSLITTYSG